MASRFRCVRLVGGALFVAAVVVVTSSARAADDPWVVYEGKAGPGHGKHVVLVSGDEEYRSEEALPQLGRILAERHGFKCTVLFAIDPETGIIDPNYTSNIPGLEALDKADLLVLFTRFRNLPDEQMQHVDDYLRSGRPVIGLRTSTHGFKFPADSRWAHYSNGYDGDENAWADGFGRVVLGERWFSHHGRHKHESTRGLIAPNASSHPILRGIASGDIWGATDVYGVRLPLPGDSRPLVLGQVIERMGEFDESDPFYGMRPDDGPPVAGEKNDPLMPIAWTKSYQLPGGKKGRSFTSTIGASVDLVNEATRRLLVNAVYWCVGIGDQIPAGGTNVALVGEYHPTKYEARRGDYWPTRRMMPSEYKVPAAGR